MAQHAHGGDVQQQPCCGSDIEAHPGDSHGAEDVAVREREDAAAAALCEVEELLGSLVHLCRCLAAWAAVFIDFPVRSGFVDRLRGDAFVIAVVDLPKKRGERGVGKPGDFGGARCTLKGARIDRVELEAGQTGSERSRLLLTVLGQGQIGAAGVASVEGPLGLTMPGEKDLDRQAGLPLISGRPERSDRLALSMTAPALTRWPGRMQTSPTDA